MIEDRTLVNAAEQGRPRVVVGLRLLRLVGSGGEGEVWEVRDERGRRRALKLIRPDALAADAEARSRHLLAINHPSLVRVYRGGRLCGGSLEGWGFLEMEFIDGPSLQDAPADPGVLDRLWSLAEALDHLHAGTWTDGLPLVHRDVKPANLVEDSDGELVLVDPSTLRGIDATELTRIGTPVFSAPEVMTGRFGPPADVYSFAVTVVALLTGERGEALAALLDEAHLLDLPDGVAYALSPVPDDRPTSCSAVLEAGTELADDPTNLLPALDRLHREPVHTRVLERGTPSGPGAAGVPAAGGEVRVRRRRLWPWVWLFTLLLGVPLLAGLAGVVTRDLVVPVLAAVGGLHLVAQLIAGASMGLAVLCPPVAWGVLLGRRVAGGSRRRAWGSATFTGAMAPGVAGLVWVALRGSFADPTLALAGAGVTLLLVLAVAAAADGDGAGAVTARLLLLPLWAAGGAVLVLGTLLLAPLGLGRGTAWTTLTSLGEGLRGPAMMRVS